MPDMIRVSTHPEFHDLVFRLLDLQGADGIVLSVQPDTRGHVSVGTKGRFKNKGEFESYLRRSNLPFQTTEINATGNYVMKKDLLEAEFYQLA